ncbi:hypothetical protein GCM10012275_42400 [Longimycelium tulufanense]|uniref:DUF397 domain-containing protein n=1 Tax=Longimycelium tulufanense TaxID=907463 RepID=A0A8J3CHB4_9PSEU|nr:DUF397 domain-containing protein [Longimycelium tulufanense]GGM67327.1 hypothetical protein GCM10012275_42400 [Longimycelium tulufanense]
MTTASSRLRWRRSSRSAGTGNCVEVADGWRKSGRSGNTGNCVEVDSVESVYVRDTKQARLGGARTVLSFSYSAFVAFLTAVKAGAVDPPR